MSDFDEHDEIEISRKRSASRSREEEFEEWRKVLTIFIVGGDVNGSHKTLFREWF